MNLIRILLLMPLLLCAVERDALVVNFIQPTDEKVENSNIDYSAIINSLQQELAKTGQYNVLNYSDVFNSRNLIDESKKISYDAYNVSNFGYQLGVALIAMGRLRVVGDDVWIQVGLFDVDIQEKINEVTEYCQREELITKVIPLIAKKIAGVYKGPKKVVKPIQKTVVGKGISYWKFGVAVALSATAGFFIGLNFFPEEEVKETPPSSFEW